MSEPDPAHPPRILIVDDSRMVRASIMKHVRGSYDVREEADGEAGWQTLLLDPTIQLVISDLSMPKLDGYGLLERIRTSRISRIHDVPVIMISGDEEDAARGRAKSLGATDFITKGIGTVELLSRLEGSIKAVQVKRELDASREALANHKPIDPKLGLVTRQYLNLHGEQLLSLARRHFGELSLMAIEIDGFEELTSRYGGQVVALIIRKLAKILATRVRKEDTVAQLGEARFCIVSPTINIMGCSAFAARLRSAIESIALGYRGEMIRISLTIGLANSRSDKRDSIDELIDLALERVVAGHAAGGNRVVPSPAEIQPPSGDEQMMLERALGLIQLQQAEEVRPHMPALVRRLVPLLQLIEDEYKLGIPIGELVQRCGGVSPNETQFGFTRKTTATTDRRITTTDIGAVAPGEPGEKR
jgi:diguanylate cyclase (GGDEF)-like protein